MFLSPEQCKKALLHQNSGWAVKKLTLIEFDRYVQQQEWHNMFNGVNYLCWNFFLPRSPH